MPLPLPGNTISFLDLATEFIDSPDYQIRDYYRGGPLVANINENANVPLFVLGSNDAWSIANTIYYSFDYSSVNAWNTVSQTGGTQYTNFKDQTGNSINLGNFYGAKRTGSARPTIYINLNVNGVANTLTACTSSITAPYITDGTTWSAINLFSVANANASFINGNTDIVLMNYGKIVSNVVVNALNYVNYYPSGTTIDAAAQTASTLANTYALSIPGEFLPGTKITIVNRGQISGAGGLHRQPSVAILGSNPYYSGSSGTNGIFVDPIFSTDPYSNSRVTILNQGIIAGGGGSGVTGYGGYIVTPSPPKGGGGITYIYGGMGGSGGGHGIWNSPSLVPGQYFYPGVYNGVKGQTGAPGTQPAPPGSPGGDLGQAGSSNPFLGGVQAGAGGTAISGLNGIRFIGPMGVVYGNTA